MRVFVVGTGRCGSVTFCKACGHITNYTVDHERVFTLRDKLDWPDQHIAVEPSMWPLVPLLRERYPELVLVHLVREDRAAFCASYRKLTSPPFIGAAAYRIPKEMRPPERANWEGAPPTIDVWSACCVGHPANEEERLERIGLYYDTVNATVAAMQPDVVVKLERPRIAWQRFWATIGAEGDFVRSLGEWNTKHNSSQEREATDE